MFSYIFLLFLIRILKISNLTFFFFRKSDFEAFYGLLFVTIVLVMENSVGRSFSEPWKLFFFGKIRILEKLGSFTFLYVPIGILYIPIYCPIFFLYISYIFLYILIFYLYFRTLNM